MQVSVCVRACVCFPAMLSVSILVWPIDESGSLDNLGLKSVPARAEGATRETICADIL